MRTIREEPPGLLSFLPVSLRVDQSPAIPAFGPGRLLSSSLGTIQRTPARALGSGKTANLQKRARQETMRHKPPSPPRVEISIETHENGSSDSDCREPTLETECRQLAQPRA